jgi:hypothetical protein
MHPVVSVDDEISVIGWDQYEDTNVGCGRDIGSIKIALATGLEGELDSLCSKKAQGVPPPFARSGISAINNSTA